MNRYTIIAVTVAMALFGVTSLIVMTTNKDSSFLELSLDLRFGSKS